MNKLLLSALLAMAASAAHAQPVSQFPQATSVSAADLLLCSQGTGISGHFLTHACPVGLLPYASSTNLKVTATTTPLTADVGNDGGQDVQAANYIHIALPNHTALASGQAITVVDPGSGVRSGPNNAALSTTISAFRAGFPSSTVNGEMDALTIFGRQARGDGNALDVNWQCVYAYCAFAEGYVQLVSATNAANVLQGMNMQLEQMTNYQDAGSITALTFLNATTAQATVASTQNLGNGDPTVIAGATGANAAQYNGTFLITVVDATHFTYQTSGLTSAASGSPTYAMNAVSSNGVNIAATAGVIQNAFTARAVGGTLTNWLNFSGASGGFQMASSGLAMNWIDPNNYTLDLKMATPTGETSPCLEFDYANGGADLLNICASGIKSPTKSMYAAGYYVGTTAGVSCAAGAVNLSTFAVTNGIVTHC